MLGFLHLGSTTYRYRFHEVAALRALMHAAWPLRENGDDIILLSKLVQDSAGTVSEAAMTLIKTLHKYL